MGKQAEFTKGRGSKTGETWRMRAYSLHDDQVEIIKLALAQVRKEIGTEYDSVALTAICLGLIAGTRALPPDSLTIEQVLAKYGHAE